MTVHVERAADEEALDLDRENLYSRVFWKVIPFLLVCYLICRIDTAIVGYAKLQFVEQLRFDEAVYGLGAGIFYLGYAIFEVPSNLYLQAFGVRRTLLRIMVLWGVVTVAMLFMQTSTEFVIARFLLGVAEGGFFPGVLLYLTYWLPPDKRAAGFSIFIMANPVAGAVGGLLSGWIMQNAGVGGLSGWQALFLLMGLPAIVLGIAAYFFLVDDPEQASWLSNVEKRQIAHETGAATRKAVSKTAQLGAVLKDARVYVAALAYFSVVSTLTMFTVWAPTIVRALGSHDMTQVGLLTAVPYVVGLVGLFVVGRNSDRLRERKWHFVLCAIAAGVGIIALYFFHSVPIAGIAWLSLAAFGLFGAFGVFFAIPAGFLEQSVRPAGLAVITTVGNLAGFAMPWISGEIQVVTGDLYLSILMFGVVSILGAALIAFNFPRQTTI